jgi:hypothetical protein
METEFSTGTGRWKTHCIEEKNVGCMYVNFWDLFSHKIVIEFIISA